MLPILFCCPAGGLFAADVPQAQISNGTVRATVYLPDAEKGYYRGTRFDWAGVIATWNTPVTTTSGSGSRSTIPSARLHHGAGGRVSHG